MSDALEQFDPDAMKKRIAESVKNQFADLIPKKVWDEMINKEFQAFFEDAEVKIIPFDAENPKKRYYSNTKIWGSTAPMSPFRQMVWEAMAKILRDKIYGAFSRETFRNTIGWNPNDIIEGKDAQETLSDTLTELLRELAPEMMVAMMRGMFAGVVAKSAETIRQELQNGTTY